MSWWMHNNSAWTVTVALSVLQGNIIIISYVLASYMFKL